MFFSLYISFNRRSRGFFLKTREGTVRFLNAVNVVILIIFFCSFHKDTSFWLNFENSQHWCKLPFEVRHVPHSFWWRQRDFYKIFRRRSTFSWKKKKKTHGEKLGIYQKYIFLCFLGKVLFRGHQFCSLS